MTWQTILYFSSILLTCALTGFLAWYAWRQLPLPGVRAYAILALSECLMALTDVISMLSGTQAQALFWFNLRFIFTAIIPLIFMAFAAEYSGQQGWFSKKLLAGTMVIPVITQIVIWNNSLHGLWVKQEVSFHQNGPFWIVETSARIPGMWFIVHSFYSQIFMLAGMVLIFLTAWRIRRQYRSQAVLLIAGALVGLMASLIPTFNLMPQLKFNPFIPGIGVSALLYALSIFRYQFLKHIPAQESNSRITSFDSQEKYSLAIFIFIFILFTSVIAAVSYITYQNYEKQFRAQVEEQLSAIATLKVNDLQHWRNERLADANLFYQNESFSGLVQRYLENPYDTDAQNRLNNWLEKIQANPEYERVSLLDSKGNERISSPAAPEVPNVHLMDQVAPNLTSGQVTMLDFHRDSVNGHIHLALLVPIFNPQNGNPLGILILRIDPEIYLYPFLQQWPTPSESAETLLIRREGEDALFLNPLRFQPDAALNLRIPLKRTQTLSVKAALGQEGVVQGVDYRNVEVIGDLRAVPNSPWFLVARMDTAEAYTPLRERLLQTVLFFGLWVLITGAGLMLVWRQQQMRFYRGQVEATETLRASEERFRRAIFSAPFPIMIHAEDGEVVTINSTWTKLTGYTHGDIPTIADWTQKAYGTRMKLVRADIDVLYSLDEPKDEGEYTIMTRNREAQTWEFSSAPIGRLPDGRRLVISMALDVTERKQAEVSLRESEEHLRLAVSAGRMGTWDRNFISDQLDWSVECKAMFGLAPEIEMNDERFINALHPEDRAPTDLAVGEALEKHTDFNAEYRAVWPDGTIHWIAAQGHGYYDEAGQAIRMSGVTFDITERKRADEFLRESQAQLHAIMDYSPALISIKDLNGNIILANQSFAALDAPPLNKLIGKNVFDVFPKEVAELLWSNDLAALEAKAPVRSEEVVKHKDGVWHTYLTVKFPIYLTSDQPFGICAISNDITERKQAEVSLRETNEYLDNLFNYANAPIIVWDPQFKITRFNHAFEELTGRNEREVIGASLEILFPPAQIKPSMELIQRTLSGERWEIVEISIQHVDGSICTVLWNSATLFSADGKSPIATIAQGQDITERKRAEDVILQEKNFNQAVLNSLPGLFYLFDEQGHYLRWNRNYETVSGYSAEEISRMSPLDYFNEPDKSIVAAAIQQVFTTGEVVVEGNFVSKNQTQTPHFFTGKLFWFEGKRCLIGMGIDITERKRAEDALRKSESNYRGIFQGMGEALQICELIFDMEGRPVDNLLLDVNPAYEKHTGIHREQVVGRRIKEILPIVEQAWLDRYAEVVHTRKPIHFEEYNDALHQWFEVNASHMNGNQFSVFFSDITERKRAEDSMREYSTRLETEVEQRTRELRESQEQLVRQERLAMLGQVAGGIGHELRNPLGVISNAIYYLKMAEPNASDNVKEYLDIIEKETRVSDKIITDLLDFTRIKSLDRQSASVSELVHETLKRYPVPSPVDVTIDIPADLPPIFADTQHVVQILGNLTTNAWQALPSTGGRMVISANSHNDMVSISVRDTGMGITTENLGKIFEPLFTTKTKGIGLGLAVSRKLAEANAGRIEVKSEVDKGTTFTVYLPIHSVTASGS